jgi:pyruvate,water dikinase
MENNALRMDNLWILSLDRVRLADAGRVGRKAAALGELMEAGFPVPAGVCLTAQAFFDALGPRRAAIEAILRQHDQQVPGQALAASASIEPLLEDLHVPNSVMVGLEQAFAGLDFGNGPLAVRSSALCEDADQASYAGQYASRIGVYGLAGVLIAITEVWRSYYNPGALAARTHPQAGCREAGLGVLIQPVVDAECAGVCFTIDPAHLRRDQIVISAAWGLGTGVVDGLAAADTYRVRRNTLEIGERRIIEKLEKIGVNPAGGLEKTSVLADARHAACLPESWLKRLAEFALAADLRFGCPQDVEWAIAGQKVWILQSRPIAALPPELSRPAFPVEWETPEDRQRLWRVVPFGAHGPLLPAEWDYTDATAASRMEGAVLVGDEMTTEVKFFNGRPYFTIVPTPLSPGDRRIRQWMKADLDRRLYEEGRNTWDYWGPEVIAAVQRLGAFDLDGSPGAALAEHLEDTLGAVRRHWVIHSQIWSPAWARLRSLYTSITGLEEEAADEAIHRLLVGEENALTRLIDGLYELGMAARESAVLSGFMASPPPAPLEHLAELDKILPAEERKIVARFRPRLQAFLAEWGDRTGKGFGSEGILLTTPTWREDPSIPLRMASLFEDPSVEAPALARQRARQASDAQVEDLLDRCADAQKAVEFRRLLAQVRRDATTLEDHNHYIDQISSGQFHAAYLAAGRRLVGQGCLASAQDVLWLRAGEVCAALRGEADKLPACPTIDDLVDVRKAQHARWAALETPPILGLPEAGLPERPPLQPELSLEAASEPANLGQVSGQPAAPGRRAGRARLILGGAPLPEFAPGDILVAVNAGPLWTPFFPVLGGLVLDGGNLGQHAAATAREYGIPAVIHARSAWGPATQVIPDGAWVAVDGSAGIVSIENGEP